MAQNLTIFKEPQCLVYTGPDGKLTVSANVQSQLKQIDKEVIVVTIAGPYRTGKSYLLNTLADQKKGFALGSTIQSKTNGVWILAREHPGKKDKCIILLDTEGLGDVEKGDENHDNQLLCLAVLLSSTMVYNVKGVIGNDTLQKLHFITELSKHVQIRSNNGQESETEDTDFYLYSPDFVYALRDFTLELKIDEQEVTADEYLEYSLALRDGNLPEINDYNKIRSCIRRYFNKRKCFTFVPPVDGGNCIYLDTVPDEKLAPDFLREIMAFKEYILSESQIKQVHGKKLHGRMLGSLLEAYVEQMSIGMPCVENAVDTMAQLENRHAKEEAVAQYIGVMLGLLTKPVPDYVELSLRHSKCVQNANDLFLSKAVFDQDHKYQKQMNEELGKKYCELVQKNEDLCKERCNEALEKYYKPIEQKYKDGHYTKSGGFQLYREDIKQFQETYQKTEGDLATKMSHVLLYFLEKKRVQADAILQADGSIAAAQRQQEAERQKVSDMERQKKEAERAAESLKAMAEEQAKAHQQNIERLEENIAQNARTAQEDFEKAMDRKLNERQLQIEEEIEEEARDLKRSIADLQAQLNNQRNCVII